MNIILIYFAIKYKGDWDKIYKALEGKEKVSLSDLKDLEKRLEKEAFHVITILDINYPKKLKEAYKPPFVIWVKGNEKILNDKLICATGNDVDGQTRSRINKFIPELCKSHHIVTASYKGVDQEIAKHISACGMVIVLANGIATPYLNSIVTKEDLLLTEYPPFAHVTKDRMRNRNRLLASFGESLILFSSIKNGPINNLVTNFLNLGKEIYAFPGSGSEFDGNSELIKQGANLITKIKDLSQ